MCSSDLVDPEDRRNRLITVTRRGNAKLAETDALWANAQRGFEAAFGAAKSDSLREALRFLISDGFASAFERNLSAPTPKRSGDAQKRHSQPAYC